MKILNIHNNHKVDMKKVILGVAIACLALSCKKVQAGGNIGVLKLEEGTERYTDDEMSDKATEGKEANAKTVDGTATADSTKKATPALMDSAKIIPANLQSPMRERK